MVLRRFAQHLDSLTGRAVAAPRPLSFADHKDAARVIPTLLTIRWTGIPPPKIHAGRRQYVERKIAGLASHDGDHVVDRRRIVTTKPI